MKCAKCKTNAVINMRHHHLALCKEHYIDWVRLQTQRTIEKYRMFSPDERILLAVSGGKDSLGLWDVLHHLGYQVDGMYIHLGISGEYAYSQESHTLAERFAAQRNLVLHQVHLKDTYGEDIQEISCRTQRGHGRPCSVCGLVKRYLMNRFALENGYAALATGHNLDDEAAVLFGNVLSWDEDLLERQYPVLPAGEGFVRKVKPFCRLYERESAAYTLLQNIEYVYEECPFSTGSKLLYYKDLLNRIENEMPGTKLRFYLSFLKAKKNGVIRVREEAQKSGEMVYCDRCGQPTTYPGLCVFCRLMEKKNQAVSR